MTNTYKQKRQEGFTIIEVLIVLAIAALILLIVFLAVPALQRNARNTSRRADVSNSLASMNEYVANNNGQLPPAPLGTTTLVWGTVGTNTTSETKVNYYTNGPGTGQGQINVVQYTANVPWTGTIDGSYDYVYIVKGGQCVGNNTIQRGGSRAIAALYAIETGASSWAAQCLAS
jgi:prepilin-type N-terminal cleavage/methylation domain-containing protein